MFSFKVGPNYPHEPPKVKCETQVYHPNIDLDGNVCLNILREDWKPVLTINSIVYGLQYLFLVCIIPLLLILHNLYFMKEDYVTFAFFIYIYINFTIRIFTVVIFFSIMLLITWFS